jgi:hypothetical protein
MYKRPFHKRPVLTAGLAILAAIPLAVIAQQLHPHVNRQRSAPDASPGAVVSQIIGASSLVSIVYHRPAVKGRTIWTGNSLEANAIVPHNNNPGPWRAGANEATKILLPVDVKIEGQPLPKGEYSFFIIPAGGEWTLIFNKVADQWGAYSYSQDQDALRVSVTPRDAPHQEWLTYTFDDLAPNACTATLHWGTKKIGFRIELADSATATPAPTPELSAAAGR